MSILAAFATLGLAVAPGAAAPPRMGVRELEEMMKIKPPISSYLVDRGKEYCVSPVLLLGLMQLSQEKHVRPEEVLANIEALGERFHDFQAGVGDVRATAVIGAMKLPIPPAGTCDYTAAFTALGDGLTRFGDPYASRKVVALLEISALAEVVKGGEAEVRRGIELGKTRYDTTGVAP